MNRSRQSSYPTSVGFVDRHMEGNDFDEDLCQLSIYNGKWVGLFPSDRYGQRKQFSSVGNFCDLIDSCIPNLATDSGVWIFVRMVGIVCVGPVLFLAFRKHAPGLNGLE